MIDAVIYIVKAGDTTRYKVGFVNNYARVWKRVKELQAGCPHHLSLVATIPNGSERLEAEIHRRMVEWGLVGEWFEDNPIIQQLIQQHPPFGFEPLPDHIRPAGDNVRYGYINAMQFTVFVRDGIALRCKSELGPVSMEMCEVGNVVDLIYSMMQGKPFNIEFVNEWKAMRDCDKIHA